MPTYDHLRTPKTWLAALVVIAAIVAVIVGFSWNGGASQRGNRSADIGQKTQRLNGSGSSGGTNSEALR